MTMRAEEAAQALLLDHLEKRRLVPFARDWGATDLAGAYAIQEALVRRLMPVHGPRVGYKIALTSVRMQQLCGIDHPLVGSVLASRRQHSGIVRRLSDLVHLGLEFEICVRMGRDLPPREAAYGMDDIAAAVGAVAPAFEVIDDRHSPYPLDLLSLVADNAWNEGIVLGEFQEHWPELASVRAVVERNGVVVDEGAGSAALGHPFAPVVWLANHLSRQGETLRAGEIVSTGNLVTTHFPEPGDHFRFTVEGIGATEIVLAP